MTNVGAAATKKTAATAAQRAHVTPEKASAKKAATGKTATREGRKTAKGRTTQATSPKKAAKAGNKVVNSVTVKRASAPRAGSKGSKIIEMIGRAKGATLAEIMKATNWQAHSVRGFISTAARKHSIKIESTKNEAGVRFYEIAK